MESLAANDSPDLTGSLIAVRDIEELQGSVFPWQLDMRQVCGGTMNARLRIGQVDDILVTRERWSRKVVAVGASPRGYLALGGLGSKKPLIWCGHEIGPRQLVCGLDAADVDFATPQSTDHWVVLIPVESVVAYLGEETVAALRERRVLHSEPSLSIRLLSLPNRAVAQRTGSIETGPGRLSNRALKADLLDAAARLVLGDHPIRHDSSLRQRYQTCR